ncbi:nucleoside hydrolase-like domain-containing protein [Cyclobacterium sp.]|uniref:nucleoside hydrolase-like domain-containing protein n=1 Tax=Cyclobacterium sp. TaxID=1966343 RepID=UPI0025C22BF1|nr:nucleoside hydrolase-like domain-containing protein [Cyclobacterium sp.]
MKKVNLSLFLILFLSNNLFAQEGIKKAPSKPRIVVLTDVSTWETDDNESLVRLMAHADLLKIEALIFTTGWSLDKTRENFMGLIHTAIDAYEDTMMVAFMTSLCFRSYPEKMLWLSAKGMYPKPIQILKKMMEN